MEASSQLTSIINSKNVKTVGIAKIEVDGIEDVYNMEVADNHNFAINGGLIVHNCMDAFRYFVNSEKIYQRIEDKTESKYTSIFG